MNNPLTHKISSIDFLRFISLIAVIGIHVSAVIVYKPEIDIWWHFSNLVSSSLRFCVPIFVMISGALLLGRELNFFKFIKQNLILRILVPFIFWYFVYYFFAPTINLVHFWYVYMLIGLYLCVPILSDFIVKYKQSDILKILVIFGAFILLNEHFKLVNLPVFIKFIPYLILGYYLHHFVSFKKSLSIKLGLGFYLASTLITLTGTYWLTIQSGMLKTNFYEYLTLNVALQSIGIFLIFKDINFKSKLIEFINKHSYGIYLNHILVITLLGQIGIYHSLFNPIFGGLITIALTLLISSVGSEILFKVPVIGKYISGSK